VIRTSSDLETILKQVAEEDYASEELEIEKNLLRFKSLLLEIAKAQKWDLAIWVEGANVKDAEKYEKTLNLLERGNLVKGKLKYTERDAYREYQLTKKGFELLKKLQKET
jgi:predicted transcriptional regulator